MRYTAAENSGAMYWSENQVSYVLSGPMDKEKLNHVRASSTTRTRKAAEAVWRVADLSRPNSDIKNLELEHGRVQISYQVLTKSCDAFDPPIDASGLDWGLYRAGPPARGRTFISPRRL